MKKLILLFLLVSCASPKEIKKQGFTDGCAVGVFRTIQEIGLDPRAVDLGMVTQFCLEAGDKFYER